MRWIFLSLTLAVLNCEIESESTVFPSYLLNRRPVYAKLDDSDPLTSVTNFYTKSGLMGSFEETLVPHRKKRHLSDLTLELTQSFSRFHKELPSLLVHFERNQNLRTKRSVKSSKVQTNKQLSKRDDIPPPAVDANQTYEQQLNVDRKVSSLIDQKPFVIDSPSEPAPHVYKDELTDEIIINSRISPNTQTTSLPLDVNLYTDVHYKVEGNAAENIQNQVSTENVEPSGYEPLNQPQDLKLSENSVPVLDSKQPYVETLVETPSELPGQNNIDTTATPIRPGYPEVILPKESKTELNKNVNPPQTQPSKPFPFKKGKPKLPFVTPFNPYTTLFLPSAGSSLYHLPLQVPILNLPVNPYF